MEKDKDFAPFPICTTQRRVWTEMHINRSVKKGWGVVVLRQGSDCSPLGEDRISMLYLQSQGPSSIVTSSYKMTLGQNY